MPYSLVKVNSTQEWIDYHDIRKSVLFLDRPYDKNHPDEFNTNNFPLLLKFDNKSIATVRLDLYTDNAAILRLIAVIKEESGKGHGRMFQKFIEKFVKSYGVNRLLVNAEPSAIGYYKKMGFIEEIWDKSELYGIAENCIQMSKKL